MSVRIEKIKVNRDGPLQEDFVLNTGDFNLIYGVNETGKTYLMEAIIKMLFGRDGIPLLRSSSPVGGRGRFCTHEWIAGLRRNRFLHQEHDRKGTFRELFPEVPERSCRLISRNY